MSTMTATKTRRPARRTSKHAAQPAERQELDWQKLIELALTAPGSTGNTYCRFYEYSWLNCMLLAMQGVTEPVATYNRWQEMGRQVKKGSKAYWITRPIMVTSKTQVDDEGNPVKFKRFREVKCLFTVSQTEGDELPQVPPRGWDTTTAEQALDIKQVPYASADGNMQGYSSERTYALNPVAVHPDHTRFHEFAHIVLGHTAKDNLGEYVKHRGLFEFEAEATAYLVMHELELLDEQAASHSRAYIQGWLHGEERPTDAVIRKVFAAVNTILKAGRPAQAEEAE